MQSNSFRKAKVVALFCAALGFAGPSFSQPEPATLPVSPPAVPVAPPVVPPPVPVMPPPVPEVPALSIFVVQSGAQTGPYNAQQLTDLAKSGAISGSTMVWQEGMANWEPASTVAALAPIFANAPAGPDPKQYLQGTWVSAASNVPIEGMGVGIANMIVNYDARGGLSGYGTIDVESAYGPVQFSITIQGTYSAQMSGPNAIVVTPNAQFSMSIPGQVPNTSPSNTPIRLTILSPTSYRDDDGVLYTKQ